MYLRLFESHIQSVARYFSGLKRNGQTYTSYYTPVIHRNIQHIILYEHLRVCDFRFESYFCLNFIPNFSEFSSEFWNGKWYNSVFALHQIVSFSCMRNTPCWIAYKFDSLCEVNTIFWYHVGKHVRHSPISCDARGDFQPGVSDHLILSRYVCSNIVANIVSNIYMYVMRHVRT